MCVNLLPHTAKALAYAPNRLGRKLAKPARQGAPSALQGAMPGGPASPAPRVQPPAPTPRHTP